MALKLSLLLAMCAFALVSTQTPKYAGLKIDYPQLADRFKGEEISGLGNRFGEGPVGPTERIPADALGDRALIERISKWPVDQQPFWYLNWRQIEANRERRLTGTSF